MLWSLVALCCCVGCAGGRGVSLVERPAPVFAAAAVLADDSVGAVALDDYRGGYVLIAFYPADFTFVCPTEIIALDERLAEFDRRDCAVMGISVDPVETHLRWKRTPRDKGGIGAIRYPLASDPDRSIARAYGVLNGESVALRAFVLVDREGTVRHMLVNDSSTGRSVDEAMRILDAVRFVDEHPEVCPADWTPEKKALAPSPEGISEYLKGSRAP